MPQHYSQISSIRTPQGFFSSFMFTDWRPPTNSNLSSPFPPHYFVHKFARNPHPPFPPFAAIDILGCGGPRYHDESLKTMEGYNVGYLASAEPSLKLGAVFHIKCRRKFAPMDGWRTSAIRRTQRNARWRPMSRVKDFRL